MAVRPNCSLIWLATEQKKAPRERGLKWGIYEEK